MIKLKDNFKRGTREYRCLHRDEAFFIFEVTNTVNETKDVYYEVFNLRLTKMHPMAKDFDPEERVEAYPSDESFGYWAWCCSNGKVVIKVLREHYGLTTQDIQNLGSGNANLAFLLPLMEELPTEPLNDDYSDSGEAEM